jgi:hypothetical protein
LNGSERSYLQGVAKSKGYEVHWSYGSTQVRRVVFERKEAGIEKIVGVACNEQIESMMGYLNDAGIELSKVRHVALSQVGCKNTGVNVMEVVRLLD